MVRLLRIALLLLAVAGPAQEPEKRQPPLVPVRLVCQWLPQSQFAGYYMARNRQIYQQHGLEVTILHAGPGPSSIDFLVEGRGDIATMFLSDGVVQRANGVPINLLAQIVNRSNLMLVAWKAPGITVPADLDGQPISYWHGTFSVAFEAFFAQQQIKPVGLPQHYSVNLFLAHGVTACAAMHYNEYHRLYQAGIDFDRLTVFMMRDYGLGFPEDGLYCLDTYRLMYPRVCEAFTEATLEGWRYARDNPDHAVAAVLAESRRAEVPVNEPHTRWMLASILDSVFPGAEDTWRFGKLAPTTYEQTVKALRQHGALTREAADYATFTGEVLR